MKASLFALLLVGLTPRMAFAGDIPAPGLYLNSAGSPLLSLIPAAQKTIDIEIYTMGDVEVRGLIRDALARGVVVRILKEPNPVDSTCDVFATTPSTNADCADQQKLVTDVQAAGGTYQAFDKKTLCPNGGGKDGGSCFEHGKIVIVDAALGSATAMISTGNFDDTNLCIASEKPSTCDRDYSMIVDDAQVIGTLEDIFTADLKGASYDVTSLIPSSLQDVLTVSPFSLQPLEDFIASATTSIDVETQYLEDTDINNALVAAARKGVKVSVTVASSCAFGKPSASETKETTTTYSAFDSAGISTAMFNSSNRINGIPGYLHAKAIVVDGTRGWMGSENGSSTSLTENREYGIFFDTPSDVSMLLSQIQADHDSTDSETWEQALKCTKDKATVTSSSSSPTKKRRR